MNEKEFVNDTIKKSGASSRKDDVMESERYEKRKRILSLIKMGVIGATIILVIVYGTLGWFTQSREDDINSFSLISSKDRSVRVQYEAFRYDPDTSSCVRINIFNLTNPNGLLMNEYDTIFTDRNDNTGILMKIEITGEVDEGKYAVLRLDRNSGEHSSSNVYISDISYFQCAPDDVCGLESYEDDTDDMWAAAKTYFAGASSPVKQTFGTNNEIDLMSFDVTDFGRTVIWLYMNYDETLVRRVISNTSFSLNQTIDVTRDCNIIKVVQIPNTP